MLKQAPDAYDWRERDRHLDQPSADELNARSLRAQQLVRGPATVSPPTKHDAALAYVLALEASTEGDSAASVAQQRLQAAISNRPSLHQQMQERDADILAGRTPTDHGALAEVLGRREVELQGAATVCRHRLNAATKALAQSMIADIVREYAAAAVALGDAYCLLLAAAHAAGQSVMVAPARLAVPAPTGVAEQGPGMIFTGPSIVESNSAAAERTFQIRVSDLVAQIRLARAQALQQPAEEQSA